ncbi:MAG: hypothetical protein ACI83N_001522 [Hydrogenophaga sp.]|jgi:hypothetical protein
MVQNLLIVLIVVAAAAYAVWTWMPAAWRKRLGSVHPSLARALVCGACDSGCGTCAKTAAPAPSAQSIHRVIPIAVDRRAE